MRNFIPDPAKVKRRFSEPEVRQMTIELIQDETDYDAA